jgi:hypothetical protein
MGIVPDQMVHAMAAFLDFCYIARQSQITATDLIKLEDALSRFHQEREIFIEEGIRTSISLPRQHSLKHYRNLIIMFGAPLGLCSSITESKHIKAVKEPWRRSSRCNALGQMLRINQRLDKMAALYDHLEKLGYLSGRPAGDDDEKPDVVVDLMDGDDAEIVDGLVPSTADVRFPSKHGACSTCLLYLSLTHCDSVGSYPRSLAGVANYFRLPTLISAIRRYLYDQENPNADVIRMDVDLKSCPTVDSNNTQLWIYKSAVCLVHSPSDPSGPGGMRREYIRATNQWRKSGP